MPSPLEKHHGLSIRIYLAVLAFAALGAGLSDSVLSNYFKDAYQVTAFQRGMIEIPRETPGFIGIFIVSALAFLGDVRIAALAQALMIIGLTLLGFLTPPYAVMLIFIFLHSVGGHLWYPLQDSIGLQLVRKTDSAGKIVGQFKGVSTAFAMLAAIITFLGFRFQVFSFTTPVKAIFLISAAVFLIVLILLLLLNRYMGQAKAKDGEPTLTRQRARFVFRREYRYYYMLAIVSASRNRSCSCLPPGS